MRRLPPADPVGPPAKTRRRGRAKAKEDSSRVLDPTTVAVVRNEEVTLKEYGFFQFSRVCNRGKDFLAALQGIAADPDTTDVWDEVRMLFGQHEEFCRYAIAESIGKPVEWVAAIPDSEVEPLVYLWWATAGRFFFGEVVKRARGHHLKARLTGSTFSTPSAETSSVSGNTPSDN